jgi:hypothetical protein
MKKFSQINESNKSVELSTNKKEFIKNLIEESLTVENGQIKGKEALTIAINKILEINDSKTVISVLENVKARSFHNFSFEWINESILEEKKKIECASKKECECEEKAEKLEKEEETEEVKESVLNESVNEECEPKIKIEITVEDPEGEEHEEGEEILKIDEFEDPKEEECEECEDMFVEEGVNYLSDIRDLSLIMESIKNGLIETKLEDKGEQLNYILSRFTDKKVEKVVLEKISEMPSYVKTADIEQTLKNLSDEEVKNLYNEVEKVK